LLEQQRLDQGLLVTLAEPVVLGLHSLHDAALPLDIQVLLRSSEIPENIALSDTKIQNKRALSIKEENQISSPRDSEFRAYPIDGIQHPHDVAGRRTISATSLSAPAAPARMQESSAKFPVVADPSHISQAGTECGLTVSLADRQPTFFFARVSFNLNFQTLFRLSNFCTSALAVTGSRGERAWQPFCQLLRPRWPHHRG
jgi:hypothetical protein